MNSRNKILSLIGVGAVALGFAATAAIPCTSTRSMLPELAALTVSTAETIEADLLVQMRAALSAPRFARVRHSPSVEIAAVESIVVEASRLPAIDIADANVTRTVQVRQ